MTSYCLRQQKKHDLAEQVLIKMLAIYPLDTLLLVEYGILKTVTNDYEKAYAIFHDVLILDPENVTSKYYLDSFKKADG